MSLATIRTALAAAVGQVASVGVVTDYEPLATREEDFKAFFLSSALGYVQGWTVTRESTEEFGLGEDGASLEQNWANHLMVTRGYRAVGSAGSTEKAFQDLVEAVRTRLRTEQKNQLGGQAAIVGPPNARIVEARTFGGYLVHYAEITVLCREMVPVV